MQKKYRLPFILLGIGIVFSLVSIFATQHSTENWFARSGAILTFVSVVVQSKLSDIKRDNIEALFNSNLDTKKKFEYLQHKNPVHEFLYITSGITGLVGTLIWGYGDLLF